MLRSVSWRRLCPDLISTRIDEALAARYYILHQIGPTGIVLKGEQSSKKIKVFLGDPNMCSCSEFKKNHELCHHILWVMLKKFRVPRTNPLIWQQALIEREINEIILGYLRRQPADQSKSSIQSHDHTKMVTQRQIEPGDVCPICQDNLLDSTQSIVYCQFGCGQNIHTKCMKIMADNQRSVSGERILRCPLCREEFGPIQPVTSKSAKRLLVEKTSLHLGVTCSHCRVCPVPGKCYRCVTCVSYHLCHDCFSSNQVHLLHSFQMRKHSDQPWRPATRFTNHPPAEPSALPSQLLSSLQSRSLTENDYEVLLQLDLPSANHATSPSGRRSIGVSDRVVNSLHVEPLDGDHPLIVGRTNCQICARDYSRGDWIRKLPCKHQFHRECLQEWLRTNSVCPIDGKSVYTRPPRNRRLSHQTRQSTQGHKMIPLTRAMVGGPATVGQRLKCGLKGHSVDKEEDVAFTVSGQGISGGRRVHTLRKPQRPVQDCETGSSFQGRSSSSEDTTLPHISNNIAVTRQLKKQKILLTRSKRSSGVSISSVDGPSTLEPRTALLAPVISGCTLKESSTRVDCMMSQYPAERRGSSQEYMRVNQSPLHLSQEKSGVEERRTVSLPSLGGAHMRINGGMGGGTIVKGSLAHHKRNKASSIQVLETSLQVAGFKQYQQDIYPNRKQCIDAFTSLQ